MSKTHKAQYRVFYEDTDAMGIMYHANYISFCERGRSDLLRDLGFPVSNVDEQLGIGFVIRHIDANYLKMAKLDDLLTVETTIKELKNSSFMMQQSIFCQNSAVFTMDITVVCVSNETQKPVRVPQALRDQFEDYRLKDE